VLRQEQTAAWKYWTRREGADGMKWKVRPVTNIIKDESLEKNIEEKQ
jgi:hypothetical protein